jgi:hypothetical protein
MFLPRDGLGEVLEKRKKAEVVLSVIECEQVIDGLRKQGEGGKVQGAERKAAGRGSEVRGRR